MAAVFIHKQKRVYRYGFVDKKECALCVNEICKEYNLPIANPEIDKLNNSLLNIKQQVIPVEKKPAKAAMEIEVIFFTVILLICG